MLSNDQLKFLSNVSVAIGQVFFASFVIPYFVADLGVRFFVFGMMFAMGSWVVGLLVIKGIKQVEQ